jgi:hypothetical protein
VRGKEGGMMVLRKGESSRGRSRERRKERGRRRANIAIRIQLKRRKGSGTEKERRTEKEKRTRHTFAKALIRGSLSCILPAVSIRTTSNLFSLAISSARLF